jgi:hypothetical protein
MHCNAESRLGKAKGSGKQVAEARREAEAKLGQKKARHVSKTMLGAEGRAMRQCGGMAFSPSLSFC